MLWFGDGNGVGQTLEHRIDFIARRRAPETEADGPHSHVGRDAHRFQHRRQLYPARVARRSHRRRHPVEPRQYLGADSINEGHVERVRQAVRGMTVEHDAAPELPLQALPKAIAQNTHVIHGGNVAGKLAGLAQGDRQQGALRARASAAFVPGAMDQRFDRDAATHKQRPDPFRCINFVAGDRKESTPSSLTLVAILPTDCAASVWNRTPRSWAIRAQSSIGWMVPTSLLACMMLTRIVRAMIALRRSSGSRRPVPSTGRYVTRAPRRSRKRQGSSIARCSMRVVMM